MEPNLALEYPVKRLINPCHFKVLPLFDLRIIDFYTSGELPKLMLGYFLSDMAKDQGDYHVTYTSGDFTSHPYPQELILHAAQGGALQQRMPNLRHAVSVRGNTLSAAEAFTAAFPEHNGVYVSGPTTEKGSKWLVAFFKMHEMLKLFLRRLSANRPIFQTHPFSASNRCAVHPLSNFRPLPLSNRL